MSRGKLDRTYWIRYARRAEAAYSAGNAGEAMRIAKYLVKQANPPGRELDDDGRKKALVELLEWGATVIPLAAETPHGAVVIVESEVPV